MLVQILARWGLVLEGFFRYFSNCKKYAVPDRHAGWSGGCRWSNTITEMLDASQAPGARVRKIRIKLKWERNPNQSRVCSFRIFFLSLCPTVKK